MSTRKHKKKITIKYKPVSTVKKPVRISFRTKTGQRISFTATKVVRKKPVKRQRK